MSRVLVPNPARAWAGLHASTEVVQELAARYHLTGPIYWQYVWYMRSLVTGDWGVSPTTGRPVLSDLAFFFPATVELAMASIILSIIIGIPLGVLAAVYHNSKIDQSIRLFYLMGFSSPPFFVALVLLLILGYFFRILPVQGELSIGLSPPVRITGMYIVDSVLSGNWIDFWDSLSHIVMPAVALTLTYFGIITRVTRASVLETFEKDYIKASFAKGLGNMDVVLRHSLRNALIPTTTIIGLLLGWLLSGTVVIETIFLWPGVGYYAVQSIESFDFPVIMAITLLFTFGVVFANLAADIVYAILNPRIRLD
jgi:peptide/nickel transport system permease protein